MYIEFDESQHATLEHTNKDIIRDQLLNFCFYDVYYFLDFDLV